MNHKSSLQENFLKLWRSPLAKIGIGTALVVGVAAAIIVWQDNSQLEKVRILANQGKYEECIGLAKTTATQNSRIAIAAEKVGTECQTTQQKIKATSLAVVKEWLESKQKIFAPPYDSELLAKLVTGLRYTNLKNTQAWLKNTKSYHSYKLVKVGDIVDFAVVKDEAKLKIYATEDYKVYVKGVLDKNVGDFRQKLYSFTLKLVDGQWKISEANSK